jgi:MtN3 and saliva related transmembrane protein
MLQVLTDAVEVIFGVGLFINALLLVPQIVKLLREKHANDISLITFAGFVGINLFTVFHGIIVHDVWLVVGYSFSVVTSTIVTILIIKFRFFTK